MADIDTLKYPKKSHRKEVILPKYSEDLAEFFGIMMGDGGINVKFIKISALPLPAIIQS